MMDIKSFKINEQGKISVVYLDENEKPHPYCDYERPSPDLYNALDALILPALESCSLIGPEQYEDGCSITSLARTFPKAGRGRIKGWIMRLLPDSDADAPGGFPIPNRPVAGKTSHSDAFMEAYNNVMYELNEYVFNGKRAQGELKFEGE